MNDTTVRLSPWRRVGEVIRQLSVDEKEVASCQYRIPEAIVGSYGEGVCVAILDTGVDALHPAISDSIIETRDFTYSRYGISDMQGHGTHCAGVVAAKRQRCGVAGLCQGLSEKGGGLLIAKVLGDDGVGLAKWVASGIEWALKHEADVICMSLFMHERDEAVHNAIREAHAEFRFVVIGAVGSRCDSGHPRACGGVCYPARFREAISVSATGQDPLFGEVEGCPSQVDIAVSGERVLSCAPGGQWVRLSGVGMATAAAAGFVARALALHRV